LVILATVATIIASQAIIAGAFSITRQAVQLGFWPRMTVVHTSSHLFGQVYLPMVNGVLFLGTCCLILGFQKSNNLAAAYGVAVSGDMLITAVLTTIVARRFWRVPWGVLIPVATFFLLMDMGFFSSNILKLFDGGWVPLLVAGCCFLLMRTWRSGRESLREEFETNAVDTALFVKGLQGGRALRVPGTAVFLTSSQAGIPRSLLHNFKHNRVIHEKTILLCVQNEEIPFIPEPERLRLEELGEGLYRIVVRYGFSESPNIPAVLQKVSSPDLPLEPIRTTFFLGRETLLIKRRQGISGLRKQIFSFMSRNSRDPTNFFNLPPNRVVELGVQIAL
jgi:KUP system potassium uptake protein